MNLIEILEERTRDVSVFGNSKDRELGDIMLDYRMTEKELQERNRQMHLKLLAEKTLLAPPLTLDDAIEILNIKTNGWLSIDMCRYLVDLLYEYNFNFTGGGRD